ncbi:MAG TPA: DUF1501 domain-containing protein [Burkholderiaceae bacterium]|jgi:uncharacterized protein (DUF1501 family)|nr:DUF1501 domain-containing protein [Burkholderiaceae bacterium]
MRPLDTLPAYAGLQPGNASRRAFLKRAGLLSALGPTLPWALNLAAIGEAAAQTASDYKAMVCVFLLGGNDYANTLVPYDTDSWNTYNGFRSNIALARDTLTATALSPAAALPGGVQYALNPNLAALLPIFNAGQMAPVLNIGTLMAPTSKAQYTAKSVPLPPKLFSHNDQQSYWQASLPEGATSGWGGRVGDLFASGNGNATFTSISATGNAVFLAGRTAMQYQVSTTGPVPVNGIRANLFGSSAASTALRALMTQPRAHAFEAAHTAVSKRSVDAYDQLNTALGGVNLATPYPTGNNLADQLKIVARIIGARGALGARRQVFFVSLGGFDLHDGIPTQHPGLLTNVAGALAAFHASMQELGVGNQVTAFTATDFGRTLVSNTDGSDHGWGGMQFVLGGAVRGKSFVGTAPVLANNGPDDVGQGRLLPTISVEQFAATLAQWFGVSAQDQLALLPNLANFSTRDLGFLSG